MQAEPPFRGDLYRGTAPYYDRYRPPYPEALLDDLCQRVPVSGAGRLLDLACGTGQIAFPLAIRFAEVWAVDQEPELVAFGRDRAEQRSVTNIRWVAGSAETVRVDAEFELVTVGNAFHRLDRAAVARRIFSWLQAGGGVALIWGDSPWRGDRAWQVAMSTLLEEWRVRTGATSRIPAGWEASMDRQPHTRVLAEAGFDLVGRFDFEVERTWSAESLAGFVYSTSFLNREVLGDRPAAFARDLTERLHQSSCDGVFREVASYSYQLARKPA
jgi:SAM-dependent methyltransferase